MKEKSIYPSLETPRMNLRELSLDDADSVYRHFSDDSVTQFMDIEPCKNVDEAREIINFHIEDTGCRWGLFNKKDDSLIGTCGFHCWMKGNESKAEIGFDLAKAYWGYGLMQEALVPVIKFGFDIMKLHMIEATVEEDNKRSQKLLQKIGFVRDTELRDNLIYYYLKKSDSR
jgi:ribosomal-protein-alanine N-acetyltransferase